MGVGPLSIVNVAHQIIPLDIIMLNGSWSPCPPWLCTLTKEGEKEISHSKAYLSFIQYKSPELVCIPELTFIVCLTPILAHFLV